MQERFSLQVERRNVSLVARPCFRLCSEDTEVDREDGAEELVWLQRRSLVEDMGKEAPCHTSPSETKAITNFNFFLIQNNCLLIYASPYMLMYKMNKKNRKGKLKRAHVLPGLLEQGNQEADINLVVTLDMPLLHRRVAHVAILAKNLIKLKLDCSAFVSSTLATRDS
jgi:hypothetical protein